MADIPAFKDESTAPAVSKKVAKAAVPEVKRVKIILEENDEVPPTGLFLSVNGVGYVLRPGDKINMYLITPSITYGDGETSVKSVVTENNIKGKIGGGKKMQ